MDLTGRDLGEGGRGGRVKREEPWARRHTWSKERAAKASIGRECKRSMDDMRLAISCAEGAPVEEEKEEGGEEEIFR
jgi:hypothetical protein